MNPSKPSKQFLIRGGVAIGILAIILIVQTNWFKNLFHKNDKIAVDPNQTVGEVVDKDSNGNGIADWEERLWGLDPTVLYTGNLSNREIIEQKRKTLGGADESESLNETDRVARQAFTITTALSQQGNLTDEGLQEIANHIGSSISVKQISNHFSLKSIKTVPTSTKSLATYHATMSNLVTDYEGYTPEIDVVVQGLETGDYSGLQDLPQSIETYKMLSTKMAAIPAPIAIAKYHLDIINALYGTAEALDYMRNIEDDGVVALAGFSAYRTYNLRLEYALSQLREYLIEYGII